MSKSIDARIGHLVLSCAVLWICALSLVSCSKITGWDKATKEADESALRDRLTVIRRGIRQYAAARQELPQSLDDLVKLGYAPSLIDPMTGQADWQMVIGEDPSILKAKRGMVNVHSRSTQVSSQGTPYNTW